MASNVTKAFLIDILNQNGPQIHGRDTQWLPTLAVCYSFQGRVLKF